MRRPYERVLSIIQGAAVILALSFGTAWAQTNLLYILDASNSMWGQVGNKSKIDIAKNVLEESLSALPADVSAGLMFYGHRRRNDCNDVQLVAPFGAASRDELTGLIKAISPKGKTPIATALMTAGQAFDGRLEDNNSVLLISDGIETCGGDPCAVARNLAGRGVDLRINVVGLDVGAKARAQLQCIAKAGKGQYFDARNAGDFEVALAKVQQQVAQSTVPPKPTPPPAPKQPILYFVDNFDGDALSSDWEIIAPDPENYLVENGVLTLVARDGTQMGLAKGINVLSLKKPLPKGNWTMTARLLFAPQTLGERVWLGLANSDTDGLFAQLEADSINFDRTNVNLRGEKITKGKASGFANTVYSITGRNLKGRADFFVRNIAAVDLQLVKNGRKYTARMRLEARTGGSALPDGKWRKVQDLSSLKAPGDRLVFSFGSSSSSYLPKNGEGVIAIDWIKIETP